MKPPCLTAGSFVIRFFFNKNQVHWFFMTKRFITVYNYGGGIRGIVPAVMMAEIERRTGLRMAQMVDMFTGPSTGSILNAALTRPHRRRIGISQYKASHMVRFYEREGANIFPTDRFRDMRGLIHDFNNRTMKIGTLSKLFRHGHYSPNNLSHALYKLLGESKLEDAICSVIIPTYNIAGTALEIAKEIDEGEDAAAPTVNNFFDHGGRSVWIRHLRDNAHNPKNHKTINVRMYDAVMASCAAPSYFPCHEFSAFDPNDKVMRHYHAIDGSIFDNPCVSYHGAIRPHVPKNQDLTMLCFGTGYTSKSLTKDEWNQFGALGVVDPVNDYPLINIFLHASESALMQAFSEELGDDNLYIFNKSMFDNNGYEGVLPSSDIDNATDINIQNLKNFGHAILEENAKQLDDACQMLVQNYDAKSKMSEEDGIFEILKRNLFGD
jgi:patatin-like phospholipase/acyl hydrolase